MWSQPGVSAERFGSTWCEMTLERVDGFGQRWVKMSPYLWIGFTLAPHCEPNEGDMGVE